MSPEEKGEDDAGEEGPEDTKDTRERKRRERLREKVKESLGEGRVELGNRALEALVKDSMRDLVDRGVIVRDPQTGGYDLYEDVRRRELKLDGEIAQVAKKGRNKGEGGEEARKAGTGEEPGREKNPAGERAKRKARADGDEGRDGEGA